MNGAQDLGGMQSFGPVLPEPDEPLFHDEWEKRAFALTLAMGATGKWNIDMARAARESLPPPLYLNSSYYRIWFEALCKLLVAKGLVAADELRTGKSQQPAAEVRKLLKENVAAVLAKGSPTAREASATARFAVGDRIRTKQMNPTTHTRLPRYCRDKPGTVVAMHGVHVFPDTSATGRGEQPQWLYTVRFDAKDLWGADTSASSVCADCWESYLEPAR
jgi:nitrile hydratase